MARTTEVQECKDGQKRWDQAYLLVLEIARSIEERPETNRGGEPCE